MRKIPASFIEAENHLRRIAAVESLTDPSLRSLYDSDTRRILVYHEDQVLASATFQGAFDLVEYHFGLGNASIELQMAATSLLLAKTTGFFEAFPPSEVFFSRKANQLYRMLYGPGTGVLTKFFLSGESARLEGLNEICCRIGGNFVGRIIDYRTPQMKVETQWFAGQKAGVTRIVWFFELVQILERFHEVHDLSRRQ